MFFFHCCSVSWNCATVCLKAINNKHYKEYTFLPCIEMSSLLVSMFYLSGRIMLEFALTWPHVDNGLLGARWQKKKGPSTWNVEDGREGHEMGLKTWAGMAAAVADRAQALQNNREIMQNRMHSVAIPLPFHYRSIAIPLMFYKEPVCN